MSLTHTALSNRVASLGLTALLGVALCSCSPVSTTAPTSNQWDSLAGHWTYLPAGSGSDTAVDLTVAQDGHFVGTVRYGKELGSTGDVTGQLIGGTVFVGGQVKPRPGSAAGFKLTGTAGASGITLWREDDPSHKMVLSRVRH